MFTGLVEGVGKVMFARKTSAGMRLSVDAGNVREGVKPRDSVSVNGVCLTAAETRGRALLFDVVEETLKDTTLSKLVPGEKVNLERALRPDSRLGGHFVYGHVDATGVILGKSRGGLTLRAPGSLSAYIFPKASIAVDGISLTIQTARPPDAEISVVPATYLNTTLGLKKTGDAVNIEVDMIMKQVITLLRTHGLEFPEVNYGIRTDKENH